MLVMLRVVPLVLVLLVVILLVLVVMVMELVGWLRMLRLLLLLKPRGGWLSGQHSSQAGQAGVATRRSCSRVRRVALAGGKIAGI